MTSAGSARSAGLFFLCIACFVATCAAASFDEQRKAVGASPATQPEAAILSLLKTGIDEGKPTPAISEAQKWLRQNQPQDAMLLYHVGRASELSGDWKGAVALYQQYLAKADLKSTTADEAVYAAYVLLIERLKDENGAYAFGRNEGGRLMVCPRARQFDQWFLDEAVKRNDATAVAQRLSACVEAGLPSDLLAARYSQYFRWLLGAVDGYCDHGLPVTQDLYDAVRDLCAAMTHDEEIKLRLDWAVSVKAYNVAKIGDKTKKKVVGRIHGKVKGVTIANGNSTVGKKQPGKNAADAKAAAAQVVEEKKLELGEDVTPPVAEASALLEKYPRYVLWVMTGWAGGGNGPYYRDDYKKYWPHEAEAKMAPILAALSKLTPAEAAEFLNAAAYGNYVNNPGILELKSVQDYLKANPALLNGRNGLVVLEKEWNKLTPEEAQKIAPSLVQLANPQASIVRAIATGGKDYDKVMAALLGPELWRLGPGELNGPWADQLWHYCGRPGGNQKRDEQIAKARAVAAAFAVGDAKKEDPADKRLAAFRNLWADYKSAQPKIPFTRARAAAILKFTPELVPELLKDPNPEAQSMVRDAITSGMEDAKGSIERDERARGISHSGCDPWIFRLSRCWNGLDWMKQNKKEFYAPHPLESVLRAAVAERLSQGKIEPWLTMAWINVQFIENNAEQVKLMQALFNSPAWAGVPFEVKFAAREWFKKDAMTPAQIAWVDTADPKLVCKDMFSLTNTSDVATTAAALGKAIEGVRKSPVKMDIQGLDQLGTVTNLVFDDPKVYERVLEIADQLREPCRSQGLGRLLLPLVKEKKDPVMLHRAASYLWSYAYYGQQRDSFPAVRQLSESLLDEQPATANAMARIGLNYFTGLSAAWAFNPASDIPALKALAGKAGMKMGMMAVPVAQTDPAYPIYKSQADWQGGSEDSAWTLCSENWKQLLPVHRELSVEYLMWVMKRTIYSRDDAGQEDLIKALLTWAKEPNSQLTLTQKVEIEIAYGDIAVQRGMLKQAHEIFSRVVHNKDYQGLVARQQAALRLVSVQRMAKEFDEAIQTLGELEMERIPEMWAPTRYARAEVYYDMEEYDNAAKEVDSILARDQAHADARIMQGKLQLKRQKLMEATEVELGQVSSQQTLVPGEKLKVTLSDPTLAVSGAGTEIEVVVWADSGDKETFFLRQFGDQKTKFRGEVATALGAPKPGDKVLQVIGDDKIYYAYSERFRQKMNNISEKRGGPITVASDALLMASARKLLSEAEQRVADMEAQMARLQDNGVSKSSARAGAVAAKAAAVVSRASGVEDDSELEARDIEDLQKRLQVERVKPGKPVYVRVIDPDRSRTAGIDEVTVSVESSSGDAIGQVVLKETGTHTGWFEGVVPTAGAQARAFADSSEPGRNPNMVISAVQGYQAWRPQAKPGVASEFMVDLNDNVSLGEMTITAKEQGSKLKKFILLTGMNSREMTAVAAYPKNIIAVSEPWRPSVTIMNDTDYHHVQNARSVYDIRELEQQMDRGWLSQQFAAGIAENVDGPSVAMTNSIPDKVKWLRQNQHHNAHVIYRFRGYFYEPADITRRFKVELGKWTPQEVHPSVANPAQYMLAVDGRIISQRQEKPPDAGVAVGLEGQIDLRQGVHTFEIWSTGWDCRIGFGRSVKLLANLDAAETLGDCPDSFFDPATFPKGILAHRNGTATVTANSDGTDFTVKFATGSRTRLFNLVLVEQEGPVPVLNKIALTDAGGKRVLPVAEDFALLNKNSTLEILTGDKVAVRYVDNRYVTKGRENNERFLNVAFTTAAMQFEFFEMRKNHDEDVEYYEKMLRFAYGKPVLLTIMDADMDVSAKPDNVTVTLESKAGGKRKFVATESGDSTGIFRVSVTPVAGAPAKDNEVCVGEGETLAGVYRDEENTDPGVPTERYASIKHAAFTKPELSLSHATVTAIDPKNLPPAYNLNEGFIPVYQEQQLLEKMSPAARRTWDATRGTVRPRWTIRNSMINIARPPANGFASVLGQSLFFELSAPHLALRAGSTVDIFVQTEAGRKLAQPAQPQAPGSAIAAAQPPLFDVNVPGTIQLAAGLDPLWGGPGGINDSWRGTPQIPIYVAGLPQQGSTREQERFVCRVPLVPGVLPDHGVLTVEEYAARVRAHSMQPQNGLVVRPGDRVYVGFRYEDRDGKEQWLTASVKVITHPVLDILEDDNRTLKTSAFVGENLYLRVVDLGADVSDRSDTVKVLLQARSGAKHYVELNEVDTHTGVFKGAYPLSYLKTGSNAATNTGEYNVKAEGFPVVYGDEAGARYTDAGGQSTAAILVSISKGADGKIEPFSKKYNDPDIAMRTQFTMAESYLEVAKHHRELGETEAAGREYDQAKQLLANAMDQFRDPETRAHAEYLLGNLTLEEADATKEKDLKEERYRAALSRFLHVTGSYPDTLHASKAQFKIATVYEKLKEPDIAAQEYVKLAYKYPDSEFLATAMARLGAHFQRTAAGYEERAKPLLAKTDDKNAQFDGTAMQKLAVSEYLKAANIFARMQERFPDHDLAGKGGLYAGQAYMRAGANKDAVDAFLRVIKNEGYDGPEIRAQAMYWAGMCYESLKEPMAAYSIYKRLTYDFPESKWGSYARAQLSQEGLLNIENDLEIKRLEEKK